MTNCIDLVCKTELQALTLMELLQYRSAQQSEQCAFIFLQEGEQETARLTYQELDTLAKAIAAQLQTCTQPGDRALLLYPSGLEFIAAFFGCLYAGVVAIPAYPPRPNRSIERLQAIISDAQAAIALTTSAILPDLDRRFEEAPDLACLKWFATDEIKPQRAAQWQIPDLQPDTLAFLQYTSGSTGNPKGVMVSHRNLLHNLEYMKQAFGITAEGVSVTWLPSFHDMGLIDGLLQPLYSGILGVIMPPNAFLQKPIRWLQTISRYRATHSGAPNFAYELCAHKITEEQKRSLDLSCWINAYCGAEPIRRTTVERFISAFEPCGFQPQYFDPCYGMAESTLMISGSLANRKPIYCTAEATALEANHVIDATSATQQTRDIVACGQAWLDGKIAIAHPEHLTSCADNEVGEIWVSGASVAQGYWQRPEATQQTFQAYLQDTGEGPFLRTGDLGFLRQGELFVTGRLKDVVIIRGRNHYPQDIETTVEQCCSALRPSCSAAFSIEVGGEERLVVVAEVERRYRTRRKNNQSVEVDRRQLFDRRQADLGFEELPQALDVELVAGAIRQAIAEQHELQVHAILFLRTGSILKTSSGKIQRQACRKGFLNGTLDAIAVWQEELGSQLADAQPINVELNFPALLTQPPTQQQEILQHWLTVQIAQQLKVPLSSVKAETPLTQYGLDSVQAVSFSTTLEEAFDRAFCAALLFEYPTIGQLSQYLINQLQQPEVDHCTIDLEAEAQLDPAIQPEGQYDPSTPLQNIFLTGATGFLGAFLLQDLLQQTQATVHCLVRASNPEQGAIRIQKNLMGYGIWDEQHRDRIIPVIGDLEKPYFGWTEDQFLAFADQVDSIYHSAAYLNFIYSYNELKASNVLGTQEVLRLASRVRIKPVHYVSTIAAYESTAYARQVVTEAERPGHPEGVHLGYSQSKWVAEKLALAARDRGIPVNIYRSPLISGHSRLGSWFTDDFICRLFKGCIQMGSAPDLDMALDLSPVDYVSGAIAVLSQQPTAINQTFHLMNPESLHWNDLFDWLRSFGYPLQRLSFDAWQVQLKQLAPSHNNPLYALLPFFLKRWSSELLTIPELYQQSLKPQFDCQKTLQALAETGICCPTLSDPLLRTYFQSFIDRGFLEAPTV